MSVEQMTRVFKHSASKGTARLVLLALADVANSDGEVTAYARSQSKLARMANCDQGSVGRAIKKLVELGELEVLAVGDGRASSNYRLTIPVEGGQNEGGQDAYPAPANRVPRGRESRTQGARDARPIIPSLPVPSRPSPKTTELFHVEPGTPEPDDPSARPLAAGERVPTYEFADWYIAFPLRKGRGQAERAYATARRKATAAQLLEGARAYAAEQAAPRRPGEFRPGTCHPATWLNGERWLDERTTTGRGDPASDWDRAAASGTVSDEEL